MSGFIILLNLICDEKLTIIFMYRKMIVGSREQNATYNLEFKVYVDPNRDIPLTPEDVIVAPAFIYVSINLDTDPGNSNLFVQVCLSLFNNFVIAEYHRKLSTKD